jgi:antitoxin ParD1/3/4
LRRVDSAGVLRDGLRMIEQRQTEEASKLKALREAARIGFAALDRGEFKEFEDIQDLQAYLNELSEKVISRTTK